MTAEITEKKNTKHSGTKHKVESFEKQRKMNLNQNCGPLETVRTDDFIEYYLFPDLSQIETEKNDTLQTICEQIQQIAIKHCENYIWHKDSFRVTPRYGNANLLTENPIDDCGNLNKHLFLFSIFKQKLNFIHSKFNDSSAYLWNYTL